MKWPVVVKSPGPTLQMMGFSARSASRTAAVLAGSSSEVSPSSAAPSFMSAHAVIPLLT